MKRHRPRDDEGAAQGDVHRPARRSVRLPRGRWPGSGSGRSRSDGGDRSSRSGGGCAGCARGRAVAAAPEAVIAAEAASQRDRSQRRRRDPARRRRSGSVIGRSLCSADEPGPAARRRRAVPEHDRREEAPRNASVPPPASAAQAKPRIEEPAPAPAPPVREIAADDVPMTTRQPPEARPDAVAARGNAKTPSGRELTLDFDALERAAQDAVSPSLFHSSDLPPPPKNLFAAKEPGTGGAYRAVEADPRHEGRHDSREEAGGGRSFSTEEPGSRGGRRFRAAAVDARREVTAAFARVHARSGDPARRAALRPGAPRRDLRQHAAPAAAVALQRRARQRQVARRGDPELPRRRPRASASQVAVRTSRRAPCASRARACGP